MISYGLGIGSKVRIKPGSRFISQAEHGIGEVIANEPDGSTTWNRVKFSDGYDNNYEDEDLLVITIEEHHSTLKIEHSKLKI